MALQDLTPQLRTRLSRLERVVGLFVGLATLLMMAGLAYYIYQTAKRKGTFDTKVRYYTFARSAAGLKIGQSVKLMGREVGEITQLELQPPGDSYDVFVAFDVKEPYFGYLWEDSRAKIGASDFLGNRYIELTKGTNGPATYLFREFKEVALDQVGSLIGTNDVRFVDEIYDEWVTNILAKPMDRLTTTNLLTIANARSVTTIRLIDTPTVTKKPTGIWDHTAARYKAPDADQETRKGYFLVPDEAPALADRLEKVVSTVEGALPNILELTNRVNRVLDNSALTAAHADELLMAARPIVTNLTLITGNLTGPRGSLGEWILPPELSRQITQALISANTLLTARAGQSQHQYRERSVHTHHRRGRHGAGFEAALAPSFRVQEQARRIDPVTTRAAPRAFATRPEHRPVSRHKAGQASRLPGAEGASPTLRFIGSFHEPPRRTNRARSAEHCSAGRRTVSGSAERCSAIRFMERPGDLGRKGI